MSFRKGHTLATIARLAEVVAREFVPSLAFGNTVMVMPL